MASTDTCPATGNHPSVCGCEFHLAEAGLRLYAEIPDEKWDEIHAATADGMPF